MRKPRDIDAELKALQDKQRSLKLKRINQFGELVTATGGDALDLETLAGALLDTVERAKADPSAKEAWHAGPEFLSPRTTVEGERLRPRYSERSKRPRRRCTEPQRAHD